jgi:hypothetical protein
MRASSSAPLALAQLRLPDFDTASIGMFNGADSQGRFKASSDRRHAWCGGDIALLPTALARELFRSG